MLKTGFSFFLLSLKRCNHFCANFLDQEQSLFIVGRKRSDGGYPCKAGEFRPERCYSNPGLSNTEGNGRKKTFAISKLLTCRHPFLSIVITLNPPHEQPVSFWFSVDILFFSNETVYWYFFLNRFRYTYQVLFYAFMLIIWFLFIHGPGKHYITFWNIKR